MFTATSNNLNSTLIPVYYFLLSRILCITQVAYHLQINISSMLNTPVCKIKLSDRGKSPTVSRDDTSARTLEGEESDFDRGEICSKQLSSLSSSSQTVISGPHKMSCELSWASLLHSSCELYECERWKLGGNFSKRVRVIVSNFFHVRGGNVDGFVAISLNVPPISVSFVQQDKFFPSVKWYFLAIARFVCIGVQSNHYTTGHRIPVNSTQEYQNWIDIHEL